MIRLGLGSVMAVSAAPVAAESFDDACEPFPDGQTTVVEYHFSGDHWDLADSTGVAFEDQVRAALTQWESIRNLDGVPIVDIQETESDGVTLVIQEFWDVKAEPDVPMDKLAGVSMVNDECEPLIGFNYFRMDGIEDPDPEDPNPADEFFSRPGLIGPVAGHELGHWMGLDHTGAFDSVYETKLPRMGMCYSLSTLYDLRDSEVSLDDSTAMLQRYGFPKPEAENFGGDWLSPNPGFEASTALAGRFGFNASYGIESTGNRHGSRHLRVEPSGSANVHKVYQVVAALTPDVVVNRDRRRARGRGAQAVTGAEPATLGATFGQPTSRS